MARTRSMIVVDGRQPEASSSTSSKPARNASRVEAGRASPPPETEDAKGWSALVFLFFMVTLMLLILYSLPSVNEIEHKLGKKFVYRPKSREDFDVDREILAEYRALHTWKLVLGMTVIYVLLQTFLVPGSGTTLNVLAGCVLRDVAAYGEYTVALPFALVGATAGAFMCYTLSYALLRSAVVKRFPERVAWLRSTVLGSEDKFWLILSMRLSPAIPAWFINITMPLTPVAMWQFLLATCIGSMPSSLIGIEAGSAIARLEAGEEVLRPSGKHAAIILTLSIFAVIPHVLKKTSKAPSGDLSDFKKIVSVNRT